VTVPLFVVLMVIISRRRRIGLVRNVLVLRSLELIYYDCLS